MCRKFVEWLSRSAIVFVCCLLSVPLAPVAAQTENGARTKDDGGTPFNNALIPANALAVAAIFPAEMMAAPQMKLMPTEVASAWTIENIGVDLMDVDSITAVVGVPRSAGRGPAAPDYGIIIRLNKDFDTRLLNRKLIGGPAEMIGGYRAIPIADVPNTYLHRVDARTFIAATPDYLVSMLASSDGSGPLSELMASRSRTTAAVVGMVMEPVRDQLNQVAAQAPPNLPGPLRDLLDLPNLIQGVYLQAGFLPGDSVRLTLVGRSDADAQELATVLDNAMLFGRDLAVMQAMQEIEGTSQVPEAMRNYVSRLSEEIMTMLKPQRQGSELVMELENQGGMATSGVLVGLLLPAVQAAREAARRMSSSNNLKQIMLAFHNYENTFRKLPDAISRDEEGKPLLSWRVAILPFIEQQQLYQQFHLDEPWDSEHNIKLLEKMPPVYVDPSLSLPPGMTIYQASVGEGQLLNAEKATRFRDVTDGLSNTIAVFEANAENAVPWTKPTDVEIDQQNPLDSMGKHRPGGFNVGFADGSVKFISDSIDPETFWKLLTRAGGEVVRVNF